MLPRPVYVRSFNPQVIFSDHRPREDAFECSAPTTPPTPSIPSEKSAFKRRYPKKVSCPFCNSKFIHRGHLNVHVSRSSNDSNQITRDDLFLDVLQTTNHTLETINHVLEKCEYEIFYSKQKLT